MAITRARAHLIVVGGREFRGSRTGMPRALLEASAADSRALSSAGGENERELILGDRFQKLLVDSFPGAVVDRDTAVDGHRCDVDLRDHDRRASVLLDHAGPDASDAARHLWLSLARTSLLPGGIRVPEWHVWAGRVDRLHGPDGGERRLPDWVVQRS
ncbi:hypothetical protein [Kitasatospora sp. NPDC094011]|uniref:hypothetical protein n=1 Tax=Kitasatospora sp. NPDC094011 TaxID=3364090 RepID=UPI00382C15B3